MKYSFEKLLSKIPNRFALAQAAIKRTREIESKEKLPLPGADVKDSMTQALQEIEEDKVSLDYKKKKGDASI
jgi:DNA-directed RNA polymerase omega subunit